RPKAPARRVGKRLVECAADRALHLLAQDSELVSEQTFCGAGDILAGSSTSMRLPRDGLEYGHPSGHRGVTQEGSAAKFALRQFSWPKRRHFQARFLGVCVASTSLGLATPIRLP